MGEALHMCALHMAVLTVEPKVRNGSKADIRKSGQIQGTPSFAPSSCFAPSRETGHVRPQPGFGRGRNLAREGAKKQGRREAEVPFRAFRSLVCDSYGQAGVLGGEQAGPFAALAALKGKMGEE